MKKIILSRTDNLGDVVLTLPLAGILKSSIKDVQIYFIGKSYTRPIIEASKYIDYFIDKDEVLKNSYILHNIAADAIIYVYPDKAIAKAGYKAKIPLRIGSSHRWYHWLYCNYKISFSRKNSDLHEAELNQKLLTPFNIPLKSRQEIIPYYGFEKIKNLNSEFSDLLSSKKFNLIFHPKSKGSAREWPIENYFNLAKELPSDEIQIFLTGTASEGEAIKNQCPEILHLPHVTNLAGKLELDQLISFIYSCDGLVACSTGPLHIASALGNNVCGIYPPMKPIHPGRWSPLGKSATVLVLNKNCNDCKISQNCLCIQSIKVNEVKTIIKSWQKDKIVK
jgi:ADP-heptose:LPS heptosyltransferase